MAVNYVNKETLLTEMPYQLNEGSPLPVDITQSMTFDPVQSNQAIYVMNLVKQQESQAAFSVSTQSQKMPKHCIKRWLTILNNFVGKSTSRIVTNERGTYSHSSLSFD